MARSECPPRAKKSSSRRTSATPSTCRQRSAIRSSAGVEGGVPWTASRAVSSAAEGAAVELAVRGQRERREHGPGVGDHVGGEAAGEERPQRLQVRRIGRIGGDHGGEQRAAAGAHRHRHLAQAGVGGEDGLDLPQLDAEAAHLDLAVDAAGEFQRAVREQADEVAGAVEALARQPREGVGDEALGGEVRASQVAAGDPGAAQEQLAEPAGRHRPQVAVDGVGAHPRHQAAERHLPPAGQGVRRPRMLVEGRPDRRLGGAVGVDQPRAPAPGGPPLGERALAAGDDQPEARGEAEPLGLDRRRDLVPVGGGDVEHRDPPRRAFVQEARRLLHRPGAGDDRRPAGQGGEDLLHAHVEGQGVVVQHAVAGPEPVHPRGGPRVGRRRAVDHRDPLGGAGRARGVDHVGQVFGIDGDRDGLPARRADPLPLGVEREDGDPRPPAAGPPARRAPARATAGSRRGGRRRAPPGSRGRAAPRRRRP